MSLVDKFAGQPAAEKSLSQPSHANQNNTAPRYESLVFKKSSGAMWAVNYSHLIEVEMTEDRKTLNVAFTHRSFAIRGINLSSVFNDIRLQRTGEVAEDHSEFTQNPDNDPIIKVIEPVTTAEA